MKNIDNIKRDIYKEMLIWKESLTIRKTTLEVEGPRQVGKTFIVKKFAEENFSQIYYINLFVQQDREKMEKSRQSNLNNKEMIELFFPDFIDSPTSVLIIDEVQEYARAYNLIKPMALEMKAQLIVTGSFLGKTKKGDYFQAIAERKTLYLRSLSFPEFLGIFENGERELYEKIDLYGSGAGEDYERLKKFFNLYLTIGGYPAAVRKALDTGNLQAAFEEIEEIVKIFCKDSERYMDDITDVTVLPLLLRQIAEFLLREKRGNLHFFDELKKIDFGESTKRKATEHALSWLLKSGLIAPCDRYVDLKPGSGVMYARYYFTDVGVANYIFRLADISASNRIGRLTENFVYRTMLDNEIFGQEIPAFATYGDLEIDFFAIVEDEKQKLRAIGLEVKNPQQAGKSATELLKAGKLSYLINAGVDTHGGRSDNILKIPVYLIGRFKIQDIITLYVSSTEIAAQELLHEVTRITKF